MHWNLRIERNIAFAELEALQEELLARVRENPKEAHLLVSEPSPTFTHGLSATSRDQLWSASRLREEGVEVFPVSRGGKWTYHGPGQVVIYPIVSLGALGYSRRAVYRFVNEFRDSLTRPLLEVGLPIEAKSRPFGIFSGAAKLASFGINAERGIISHGVALYWSDQSRYFAGISPCGVPGQSVTSLQQLGWEQSWDDTASLLAQSIEKSLNH